MRTKKILLNTTPPAVCFTPSPALSILKAYLKTEEYNVDIFYWNILMEDVKKKFFDFTDDANTDGIYNLLPYYSYWAVEYNDYNLLQKIIHTIFRYKPILISVGVKYINDELIKIHDYIKRIVQDQLLRMDILSYSYIGFTTLFNQWVVSNIIVKEARSLFPDVKIIAGGFDNKKMAIAFLDNFSEYDFAIWGEGEKSLLMFSKWLEQDENLNFIEKIPNLVYRKNNKICLSKTANEFIDLNNFLPDYSDYLYQIDKSLYNEVCLPIEGGRGCHWSKCHFCFLNNGYKFRTKRPDIIVQEIRKNIETYNIMKYSFLDNDIIGGDLIRFEELLDGLISIKIDYSDFEILLSEVVTKGLSSRIIKKMYLAGFKYVQFGFENPSDKLLRKIEKVNSFTSNLLFMKFATEYNIGLISLYIIKNLLEESDEEIYQAIRNLFYMRFIYSYNISSRTSTLHISQACRYYRKLEKENKLKEWEFSINGSYLPIGYIKNENRFSLLIDHLKFDYNHLWDDWSLAENHFKENKYSYQILKCNDIIFYIEKCNNNIVNEISFESEEDLCWQILCATNHNIESLTSLLLKLKDFNEDIIKQKLAALKEEGLLFYEEDFSEIISVINTDHIQ